MKNKSPILLGIFALVLISMSSGFVSSDSQVQDTDQLRFQELHILYDSSSPGDYILSSGCTACHMEYSMTGRSMTSNIVHKPEKFGHEEAVRGYVQTHTSTQAEANRIDLHKLTIYLENLSSE